MFADWCGASKILPFFSARAVYNMQINNLICTDKHNLLIYVVAWQSVRLFVWLIMKLPISRLKRIRWNSRLWEYLCTFCLNFSEIGGVCELRSVICLIAKVIWGQSVLWLHLHFYISGIYRELKTFLESHPRVVCFFMCLINLSFWQARTISGDDDSNQSCGKKFFFSNIKFGFFIYI